MTRQTKTPRQRAEEQLAVAERAVKRLGEKKAALDAEAAEIGREYAAAVVRRDYLANHPDLDRGARPVSTTDSTGDTTA